MNSLKSFIGPEVTGSSGWLNCSYSKSSAPLLFRSSSTIILCKITHAIIMSFERFMVKKSCRPTHYCKSCLKYSEGTLHILLCRLLGCSKVFSPIPLGRCFYKCCPLRIYAISEVVSHCIVMIINCVVDRKSTTLSKIRK